MGFPGSSAGKESTCNAGDPDSISGLGRSPGKVNGFLLQYSGLENSMDCIVHGITKSQTWQWTSLSCRYINFNTDNYMKQIILAFSSVAQPCPTLYDPMDCSMTGLPVYHQLPEFTQTHVHWVGDAIQPSHPLSSPSPPAFNLSQHQGLFEWVSSSHQVAKVLERQLLHQSFQWIFRVDFL